MSLRYALLGLLDRTPSSGYDLTQRFAEEGIGSYAWSAKHSQIYPELKKLTDEGLIEITGYGARGKKTYELTAPGRNELRSWLLSPPADAGTRNEFVLRLFLLSSLNRDEAAQILHGTLTFAGEQAELLRSEFKRAVDGYEIASGGAPGMAAQFGIRSYEALADWARWALAAIQTDPTFDHD